MDKMWHYHILDTRAYCRDCDNVFGGYFHHFPYFGMRSEEDASNLVNAFEQTKAHYADAFGEQMDRNEAQKCWHSCQSRCHNACKSVDDIGTH